MNGRRLVIPDIHGCALTLRELLRHNLRISRGDRLFLLGDLIDRGPRSKEVLDEVFRLLQEGVRVSCLRGNHEQMLLDAADYPEAGKTWLLNGGHATLDSFRLNRACDIPYRYISLLRGLPFYMQMDDFILVHAAFNFRAADPLSDTWAMLWERPQKKERIRVHGRRVVCGHTPATRDSIRLSLLTDWISLDNGCVYRDRAEYGSLAALDLNTMDLIFQENID